MSSHDSDPPLAGDPTRSYPGSGHSPEDLPETEDATPTAPFDPLGLVDGIPPPSEPELLSRFRPFALHKQGGMGRVHRATDAELKREVAFKDIRPEYADQDSTRQRFLFEAEVTGRLQHPGIVPVYGLGNDADGRPYYAMRFVEGESLSEAIHKFHETIGPTGTDRSLPLRRLLARFVIVCQTVAFAHSRGIIHRDLKPDNVMLGSFGETLVVDWGIAKRIRGHTDEPESAEPEAEDEIPASVLLRSRRGSRIGTPAYWSPEQAAGRPDLHDERTDVYGLGAILFQLLTGKPPNPTGKHAAEPPNPQAIRAWVDDVLNAITRRSLALASGERFPNAESVATEIEQWLADQPVAAQRAAVEALSQSAAANPEDHALAEQFARQRVNLGLMLSGMGRGEDAIPELNAAAMSFAKLVTKRAKPRFLADEANCYLALARTLIALGRPADAETANRKASEIYRGLIASRPDEYKANYAAVMLTWAGELPAAAAAPDLTGEQTLARPPAPAASPEERTRDAPLTESRIVDPQATVPPPDSVPATGPEFTVGYTPIRELGRGGMGQVILARDNALGRTIAIKMLAPGVDPTTNHRFRREMQITASLEHPNIARVYSYGQRSNGSPFMVMEYLQGREFRLVLDELGPGWSAAHLDPLAQACDALDYAHSRGVIHRDPKPMNIFVLNSGRVVLYDWGLAKFLGTPPDTNDGETTGIAVDTSMSQTGGDHGHSGLHATRTGTGQTGRCAERCLHGWSRFISRTNGQAGSQRCGPPKPRDNDWFPDRRGDSTPARCECRGSSNSRCDLR